MTLDTIEKWLLALFTGIISSVLWVVRKILSNEKKIAALEKDLERSQALRRMDHESIKEVKEGVKDIKDILMGRGK